MNAQIFASLLYEEFKKTNLDIDYLPEFYYNVGETQNNGFIFTSQKTDVIYYGDYLNYDYTIRIYMPKVFHQKQLDLIYEFFDFVTSKVPTLSFDGYKVKLFVMENYKNPDLAWILSNIESYGSSHQGYVIPMKFVIEKEIV